MLWRLLGRFTEGELKVADIFFIGTLKEEEV